MGLSLAIFLSGGSVSALRHSITIDSGVKKFNFFLANCDDDDDDRFAAVRASNEEMAENAVAVAVVVLWDSGTDGRTVAIWKMQLMHFLD